MKSHTKIFLFTIMDMWRSKTQIHKYRYLTLVPTNESKGKIKRYEELWGKIRDLVRSIIENSDDYDEKYVKIKI